MTARRTWPLLQGNQQSSRLNRRQALGTGAAILAAGGPAFGPQATWAAVTARTVAGYGKDPALQPPAPPPWPAIVPEPEMGVIRVLALLFLPDDDLGPGALALGVADFIQEWLSAPYPEQQADRQLLLPMLASAQASGWSDLTALMLAMTEGAPHAVALRRLRALVAIGWGTTPQAAPQLGFIGNEPRMRFDGPPAEVVQLLKLRAKALGN